MDDGAEMEPPALAENVAGAADALRQGNADAFPRAVPTTQSVSPSVRQSVSPSVRQSVSPSVRQSVSPSVRQSVSPSVRQER
ncbi:hypothetical protein [Pantoea ananatis]|uniref:hypothetical protein n=1 Tax=Pantoea ananas TaxID=553 RepID=UPI0021E86AE1|nr:hypothetical protein [Pantoea ananatis]MCW1773490.1 hypothetical protein [Pantoea ananatis]UYK93327.1 hypothetical protein NG826_02265 [Pantoea ananatis]